MDLASAALLDDLSSSGRLDETLLIWAGEFGRSPKVRGDGRGHFTRCFSSMLAGGGIQGGTVYVASDSTGSAPSRDPVSPADFIATADHLLGVPSDTELVGTNGQARKIITGKAVQGVMS